MYEWIERYTVGAKLVATQNQPQGRKGRGVGRHLRNFLVTLLETRAQVMKKVRVELLPVGDRETSPG